MLIILFLVGGWTGGRVVKKKTKLMLYSTLSWSWSWLKLELSLAINEMVAWGGEGDNQNLKCKTVYIDKRFTVQNMMQWWYMWHHRSENGRQRRITKTTKYIYNVRELLSWLDLSWLDLSWAWHRSAQLALILLFCICSSMMRSSGRRQKSYTLWHGGSKIVW